MEITDKNCGKYFRFIDGQTAIFINQKITKKNFKNF
jgi:hypothetical protein